MKSYILAFSFFFSFSATAQSNMFDAYIIKPGADTVRGKAVYYFRAITPLFIEFIEKADVKRYYPADLEGFYIQNVGAFKSAAINYHPGSLDMSLLPDEFSDEIITQRVFLEIVTKGTYTLYRYENESRRYFYMQKDNGEIEELLYRLKMKNQQLEEDKTYQTQVGKMITANELNQSRDQASTLLYLGYDRKSLGDFVNRLNGNTGARVTRDPDRLYFNGEIGVGVNLNFYGSNGGELNAPINSADFSNVTTSSFHGAVIISKNPSISFIRVMAGISYHRNRLQGQSRVITQPGLSYYEKYDFDLSFITVSAGAFVIIKSQGILKFYTGLRGGAVLIKNKQPDTKLINQPNGEMYALYKNYPTFKKGAAFGSVFTGIIYKRHRIELFAQSPIEILKDEKASLSTGSFGIIYKIALLKY